jgi:hypothetical protein
MVEIWEAVRLEKQLGAGRTKPLLIDCELEGVERARRSRFVVKTLGLSEVTRASLCNEFFGHAVARACGAITPDAALISLSKPFIEANAATFAAWGLEISPGMGMGCVYIPGLIPLPSPLAFRDDDLQSAATVYAIDMLTQNPDRRRDNPNCGLGDDGKITLFDFDQAFSFRLAILRPDPCHVSEFGFHRQHVFYESLRNRHVDWAPFLNAANGLTGETILSWLADLPIDWREDAQPVVDHITTLSTRLTEFGDELARSLL